MTVPSSLGPAAVHALSNHLSIILGFVELVLADTPVGHPRHQDLVEIRDAAVQAANIIAAERTPPAETS